LPVNQIYVADCEADDIIAYLCEQRFKNKNKIIVSSDKDFYQLLNNTTKIYRPTKKVMMTSADVKNEFDVYPRNFCVCKSVCGDPSDNIPGIRGVGFKSLVKYVDILKDDSDILICDVINFCEKLSKTSKTKLYKNIFENKETVERNWKIMQLNSSVLSHGQIKRADCIIDDFVCRRDKITLMRELIQKGIQNIDVNAIFYSMLSIGDGWKKTNE